MNRLRIVCVLTLVILLSAGCFFAAAASHPRLYFTSTSVNEIKTRVVRVPAWGEFFRKTHENQRQKEWNGRICENLAFAYALSGIRVIGRSAVDLLLKAAAMPTWRDEHRADRAFLRRTGLRTSDMCVSVATAYDWTYSAMTPQERETVRSALITKGILPILTDWDLPGSRIHTLDSMGPNAWAVCLSGAGVGALAVLDEDPRASEWVRDINRSLDEWFRYPGNTIRTTSRIEAISWSPLLRYAEALLMVTGEDIISNNPAIQGPCDFFLYPAYQTSNGWLSVNFGDSSSHFVPDSPTLLDLARRMRDPHIFWYWKQVYEQPRNALDFIWLPTNLKSVPPHDLPPVRLFEGIDWAVLRDGWSPNGQLFALTCGDSWNHADAGSFVLYSDGNPLIIDSGTCPHSKKEYASYFIQSEAHNVILWNGRGQPREDQRRDSRFRGEIRGWLSTPRYTYFCADATGPYASILSRNYRHVIALDGLFVLVDDIRAYRPGIFSWLLHTEGKAAFENQTVTITNGPAAADLRFAFPADLQVEERSGLQEETAAPQPYLALNTKDSTQDVKFLSVLSIRKASDPSPPPLKPRRGSNWIGMRFPVPEGTADLLCNLLADGRRMRENSENVLDGFTTDAFLLLVVRNQEKRIVRLGMHNGSFLRDKSGPIFEALSKSELILERKTNALEAAVRSQKAARILLRCSTPTEVLVDGVSAPDQARRKSLSLQEVTLPSDTGHIRIRWTPAE